MCDGGDDDDSPIVRILVQCMNACYHRATISIQIRGYLQSLPTQLQCTNIDNKPLGCLSSFMPASCQQTEKKIHQQQIFTAHSIEFFFLHFSISGCLCLALMLDMANINASGLFSQMHSQKSDFICISFIHSFKFHYELMMWHSHYAIYV